MKQKPRLRETKLFNFAALNARATGYIAQPSAQYRRTIVRKGELSIADSSAVVSRLVP